MDTRVPNSCRLLQGCKEGKVGEDIRGVLEYHEGLKILQVIQWIGKAIVWLYRGHLESTRDRFLKDGVGERCSGTKTKGLIILSTMPLDLAQEALDLPDLSLKVLLSMVGRISRSQIFAQGG